MIKKIVFAFVFAIVLFPLGFVFVKEGTQKKVVLTAEAEASDVESLPSGRTSSISDGFEIETIEVNKDDFRIEIPKIDLKKDIEPEVDPRYREIYLPVIEKKVAHGKFTRFPHETLENGYGNVYLFAHRDGPNPFFARLGELDKGDEINIYFNGKKYIYRVFEYFITTPDNTSVYTGYASSPTLTLQTCNNGVSERLIVRGELVGSV